VVFGFGQLLVGPEGSKECGDVICLEGKQELSRNSKVHQQEHLWDSKRSLLILIGKVY